MGSFDRAGFMQNLQKVVQAGVNVIGDIPFPQYTFIGIGPGRGGIEHLNNTTVSFDGSRLNTPAAMNTMMNFLAHEYFHHYNVKRIRPLELGPFAYDRANRTQMLWVSEGLTVYYEYLIVKRAGLADASTLFKNLEGNINNYEKDPGRQHQSVAQASYYTWEDGPFGGARGGADQAISYYDKGPILGLFLDFTIRHATQNTRSIDDVMRLLYQKYYQQAKRGFSDSEFQQACEQVAGSSLSDFFAYIYNTAELDYARYLGYAGLKLERNGEKWELKKREEAGALEQKILRGWLGE
jgi:predicted metalloprotease with PDZ domain